MPCQWISVSSVSSLFLLIKLVWLVLYIFPVLMSFLVCCSTDGLKVNLSFCKAATMCLLLIGYTWCGLQLERENKNQRKHDFCCLNWKVPQMENKTVCVSTMSTDFKYLSPFSCSPRTLCLSLSFSRLQWTKHPHVPTVFSLCTYADVSQARPSCIAPSSTWLTWLDLKELARLAWMGSCWLRPSTSTAPSTTWSR